MHLLRNRFKCSDSNSGFSSEDGGRLLNSMKPPLTKNKCVCMCMCCMYVCVRTMAWQNISECLLSRKPYRVTLSQSFLSPSRNQLCLSRTTFICLLPFQSIYGIKATCCCERLVKQTGMGSLRCENSQVS